MEAFISLPVINAGNVLVISKKFKPVKKAEFNHVVESGPCNRPLRIELPESVMKRKYKIPHTPLLRSSLLNFEFTSGFFANLYSLTIRTIRGLLVLFVDYSRTNRTIRRLFELFALFASLF